jgi:hypothetical protein
VVYEGDVCLGGGVIAASTADTAREIERLDAPA